MNETQRRIKEYKEQLPHMKEKVVAMAILVVLALVMATTSTFAWLVLSRAPEVSGATTSLAANGNLEIALVGPEGRIPAESAVGDSNLDLILKNITWGNLVNLSDPRYGLDNLVLRPAQLSTATLKTQPLWGAEYKEDGRIEKLNTDFGYAMWVADKGRFEITNDYGIRVISSVTRTFADEEKERYEMRKNVEELNLAAGTSYLTIASNKSWMQSLATMMGLYMTARMNPEEESLNNSTFEASDVQNLVLMYEQFLIAFEKEAEAMAALLNYQIFLINGTTAPTYTAADIWDESKLPLSGNNLNIKVNDANENPKALRLTHLKTFRANYNTLVNDLVNLQKIAAGEGNFKWNDSGLNNVVNNLVNVGACTVGANNTPINSIGASNATQYLSGTQEAKITNGILYNFEYRTGSYIQVKELSISAKVKRMGITIPATVKANVATTAPRDTYLFLEDLDYADGLYTTPISGGTMVANDTYGLAVDLWVRTNAEGSFLTLGGNVLVETKTERATAKDADGNEVELFVVDVTFEGNDENGDAVSVTETYDLYQKDGTWYNAATHGEFVFKDYGLSEDTQPREKYVDVEYVVGYEGENRVWDGSYGLSVNSTTQGSGSCYVFYADTPEDQAKSLTLLASMKIAFVDADGKKLATAIMDTEHFYAKDGKVIVPMVLDAGDSLYLGDDTSGNARYAITALQKNVPTHITAILYLDGTKLDNTQVLSAANIQGQLNVQFESSVDLNNIDSEELRVQEMKISAELDKTAFNYDEASETNPMITNVAVTVDGNQPNSMTAFFIRKINDTQGSREETMHFTYDALSKRWTTSYEFSAPGNYILRSVRLDGIEYDLTTPQTVTIEGFTLTSLDWSEAGSTATFMTANSSVSTSVWLSFASNDANKMPKTVHGRFIRESDGSVSNVQFSYDPVSANWKGTATFAMSGEYSLQYLVLDGEYQEIPENMQKFVTAYLGMRVKIYTTSPQTFKYVQSEMRENGTDLLHMQMVILDDAGNELPGLGDVKLVYHMRGSLAKKMETGMKWDAATSKYKGDFDAITAGAGIYEFLNVQVGDDIITNAQISPTFTMISPEPPVFMNANGNTEYLFDENGGASFKVQMKHVGTAAVLAKISNGKQDYWVKGTPVGVAGDDTGTESIVTFIIPNGTDVPGKQDGNWVLEEINVWNYYDAEGNWVEAAIQCDAKGLVSEVTPSGDSQPMTKTLDVKKKVVATVKITFPSGQGKDFGKDANGNVTGTFMQTHTISGLNVTIADFEGKAIEGISSVTLVYEYNSGSSSTYGGYTSASLTNAVADFTISLSDDGSGTKFVQSGTQVVQYAGSWNTKFSFKANGSTAFYSDSTLPANAPLFTVSSVKPSAKITAISPSGSIPTRITWKTDWKGTPTFTTTDSKTNSFSNYAATVYAQATADNSTRKHGKFTQPTVTIAVANSAAGYTAKLVLPAGDASDIIFEISGNGTVKKTLGATSQIKSFGLLGHTLSAYYGHGTQTITTMTLTKDGVTYTVILDTPIVITSPSSINQTS